MASCVLSKSCPSRPSHVPLLPLPHLAFCCLRLTSSRRCVFLSCHLSSSHHLGSPCLWKAFCLSPASSSLSLSRAFSSELPAVVTAYDDSGDAGSVLGRVDTAVDVGVQGGKVGGSQYFQNIFNPEPRTGGDRLETSSNAQQQSTASGSIARNGSATNAVSDGVREPTEYDLEIYASNSMEGWAPPPPPLPPFGNIFEDYWGEVIGEDYLPKKPERSSLLAYLDTLNAAKPEAGNSATSSMPFRSSNLRRNRPLEGTRANRPIRSENLRANRPIKEPKPIDTYWSADWSEGPYDISKEADKTLSGRSGGTMPGENKFAKYPDGDGVGDSKPTERKIILGNSKLLGPLPGYGAEDAKPAERNTNVMNGDERNIILGNSKLLGPLPGYVDGDVMPVERKTMLGESYLSNLTGRDGPGEAKPVESNTTFKKSNFSYSPGRDGTEDHMLTERKVILGDSKLSEPLPEYGAGDPKPVERNTIFGQSNVSKPADGNGAGDIKPIERKITLGNSKLLGPLPAYAVGDKPVERDTTSERNNIARPVEVDAARDRDHKEGNTILVEDNIATDTTAYIGGGSRPVDLQPLGSVADYRPVENVPAGGRSGENISGRKNLLATKPDDNISSVRPEDNISAVRSMDSAMGHSELLGSTPLNITRNTVSKPLESVIDRGVESLMAPKPMQDSTSFKLEGNSVSAGSQGSLTVADMRGISAASDESVEAVRQVSQVVTQLYEPKVRDIVLGAVISANDQKLDLEIGAEHPGLMLSKDLRPFLDTNLDNIFLKLPSNDENDKPDGFVAPVGKSLIVEDKTAYNGAIAGGSAVDRGMVITAEVEGRTLGDGRAILSVRPPARRIAWHRVKQLMQVADAFDIQITQWNDGGLLSFVEGLRAFLPRSELLRRSESAVFLKEYVGRVLTVSIARVEEEEANIVISELKAWTRKYLRLGTVHDATVSKLYPFGMQVEVKNTRVRGFVHISNMSKEYVKQVADLFTEGDNVKVMLIRGRDSRQIAFSIAELESDGGLMFRDKERVFREAEEMARRFRESLSGEDQQCFGQEVLDTKLECQEPVIANMNWLHL